jgi:N-acetylmuramoyl-L-alanine amidase
VVEFRRFLLIHLAKAWVLAVTRAIDRPCAFALTILLICLGFADLGRAQQMSSVLYELAHSAEKRLRRSEDLITQKSEWLRIAGLYGNLELEHSGCRECDDAIRSEAKIQLEIYRRFHDAQAIQGALDAYRLLVNRYPTSKWVPKGLLARGRIYLDDLSDTQSARLELSSLVARWPTTPEGKAASRLLDDTETGSSILPTSSAGPVSIGDFRHWSGRGYSRMVIELSREVSYRHGRLEAPAGIYVDLLGVQLNTELVGRILAPAPPFSRLEVDVVLLQVGVTRFVLRLAGVSEYSVFPLRDPHRLVVEVSHAEAASGAPGSLMANVPDVGAQDPVQPNAGQVEHLVGEDGSFAVSPASTTAPSLALENTASMDISSAPSPSETGAAPVELRFAPTPAREGYSLARQLGLAVSRIIVDPGHGGHDPGTTGPNGLLEKDLTLEISRRLVELLDGRSGLEVVMTRETDVFVPLEDRTSLGNANGADLFVSIHINSSRRAGAQGIETYYLDFANEPQAEEVAARENAATTRRFADLPVLLEQVLNTSRSQESRDLALHVQHAMASELLETPTRELYAGVRTAPFHVLVGAGMPAVLIEAGYLSNREDAANLAVPSYRQQVADAIARGIRSYLGALSGGAASPELTPITPDP